MHPTWRYLSDWVVKMAVLHGGIVHEGNKELDWGQALCRELYGEDWMRNPEYIELDNISINDPIPNYVIARAEQWMNGENPAWAEMEK